MRRVLLFSVFLFAFTASVAAQSPQPVAKAHAAQPTATSPASPAAVQEARASFAKLPLSFEENAGQTDARVKYTSRGTGYSLFLTSDEAVFALEGGASVNCAGLKGNAASDCTRRALRESRTSDLWLKMAGANPSARIVSSDPLPGKINYYIGNDPSKWRTGVRQFGRVTYQGIYPGVDLTYYGNEQQLESDFVVAPGASPRSIEYEVTGAREVQIDAEGNLALVTSAGNARLLRPQVYQLVNSTKREISGRYILRGQNRIGFEIGKYDKRDPLIIDPVLVYSTLLGGASLSSGGDSGNAIAIDSTGDAFVTGAGRSPDFPGTAAAGPVSPNGSFDFVFVTKFDPNGNTLLYSTLLRGTTGFGTDQGNGIGVDGSGKAYVDGITTDADFPLLNPFQATIGDDPIQVLEGFNQSGFVSGLDSNGNLIYSTYFGGRNSGDQNFLTGLAADSSGDAYVVGYTSSQNFPTVLATQATLNGFENAIVAKFDPNGQPIYSTYLGGDADDLGNAIAVDASGAAYVTGETDSSTFPVQAAPVFQAALAGSENLFVAKFTFDTTLHLAQSTYLGGSETDIGYGIAVDTATPKPNVYLTGQTTSTVNTTGFTIFPTLNPIFTLPANNSSAFTNAFVTKLKGDFSALLYSTLLGATSTSTATGTAIGVDGAATPNAYVTGFTTGQKFSVANALQAVLAANTGGQNLFVTEVNGAGSALTYSTYLGGRTGDEAKGIAVDAAGNAYITGAAGSVNFPVFATVGQPYQSQLGTSSGNAFAVKISPAAAPSGLNFFPPAVSFGNQGVQFISPGQDITLSNNSASTITLNSLSLGGSNPADFTLTPGTCVNGALLTAGSSCITVLQFSPTQQDARSATLTVSSTPASAAALTLSGTGVVPEVAVNPSAVHFGTKVPLNVPALSGIQIENTGGGALIIGNVQITGPDASAFSTTLGSNCTISVVPFGNCFVTVTLNATTARAYSASLLINDNAVGSPQIVTLDGTAVAQVAVSPTAIEYGGWLLGTQSPDREIIVTNETGGNITLTGIAATGTNSGDFLVDATPPNSGGAQPCNTTPFPTMLPGVSCSFYVFFKPLTPGTTDVVDGRTATYTVSWNGAATGSQAIAVMGAAETGVTLYQNTFVAPDEFVGATERGPEIDQLFNGTANPITVTGITLGGSTPQDFQIQLDNSCSVNGTIPANSICFIDGSFSPSAVGPRSVTATINYTGAPPGTSLTLTVTGNGLAGPVTFGSSFNFGSQVSGVTSPTHRVFLENIGKGALTISNITAPAGTDFAWINRTAEGACSPTGPTATVPGGGKCFVDVTFTPSTTGSRTATLVITDNAPGSPRTLSLSGTGEPAVQMISVSPNALDFGNVALVGSGTQPTVTETFYLTNSGSQPATVTVPPALTTTTGTPFTIGTLAAAGTCGGTTLKPIPTVLAQGGFCSVIVQYKPTATGLLTNSATLSAKVGTTTTVFTVPIQGTGVDQGVLSVTPGSLTFSETANTTGGPVQNVTLTNTGSRPLVVSLLATAGPNASSFVLGAPTGATPPPTCVVGTTGMTIAAGASCATGVSFNAPGSIGKYTATLLIQANLGNNVLYPTPSTSSFPLTGNVVSGSFGVSPTPPLNFGNVAIGTTVNFSSINPINPVTFSSEISLTNNTISAVTITGIAAQNADYAIVASSCTGALAVTGSCTFDATFKPTVNGAENTNFVVSYTVAGVTGTQTFNIAVNGTGTTALIAEPNTPTVTTSVGNGTSVTVTIANGSSSTVNFVGSATVTGTGYSLSFDECATALTLAASSSCDTFINFNPTTPGSSQGQLVFKYTVGGGSQQTLTVTINGTATAAQVSIAVNTLPSTQTYPNQNINTRSLILDVVVTNTGNTSLDINTSNLKITGTNSNDFSFAESNFSSSGFNANCELPVSPGQSCTIPIAYTPAPAPLPGGTTRNATLTITDNAFPSTTQTVNLVGNAPAGSVTASPSSLGFGSLNVGSSSTQNVLVTNTTNAAVTFSNPIATFATGTSPSSYSIDATQTSNACTASTQLIAHTGSCVLYIKFTPAVVGSNTATATINTSGGAPTVALSGTGVATVVFVSPTSVTFSAAQLVGTQSSPQAVTLTNGTNASINVSSLPAVTGDYLLGTNGCTSGLTLTAGSNCTVNVIFKPTATGTRTGTLTIADSGAPSSFSIPLSGTGTAPSTIAATSGATQSVAVNHAFATLQATVKDSGGNTLPGVSVTFTVTAAGSGASGTFTGSVTSATVTTDSNGLATAPAFTANNIPGGPYTVAATAGSVGPANFSLTNLAGTPASVTPGAGTTPQSTAISTAFSTLSVTVKDSGSLALDGIVVTFTAPSSGASGTFTGGVTTAQATTNSSGLATAPTFTANGTVGGPYLVTATAGAASGSFSLTNLAGPPASVTATAGTPQSTVISTGFGTALQATVKDGVGDLLSGVVVTFTAPSTGASGTFAGGTSGGTVVTATTNASGVATATVFTANSTVGSYTVNASVAGVATKAAFALNNTAGPAANIAATAGATQSAAVTSAFAINLAATVTDSGGNPISGATVTFTAPSTGASGAFAGGTSGGTVVTATTNASGVATASVFTANSTIGGYTVTAAVPGVVAKASFSLTNIAGPPATITATAGTPQSTTISTAFATALQATVKDAGGNPISGATVTFTSPSTGASATFTGGTSGGTVVTATTNASGVATASALTANSVAGGYTVTAAVSGVATKANFSLTNNVGAAASITATAGTPQSTTISTAFVTALQATVKDGGGNLVSGATVTFTSPSSGASATFAGGTSGGTVVTATTNASGVATASTLTANSTAGGYTVTAAVTGVATKANFSLTNNVGAAAGITATAGTPQSATISTAFATALQATVKDAGGNLVSGATVTFTSPSTGASGTFAGGTLNGTTITATTNASGIATAAAFTANKTAGSYTVNATVSGVGAPAPFSLTNNVGAAAAIAATGGATQSVAINTAFASLQATVTDSGGNGVNGVSVTFTVTAAGNGASGTFPGSATSVTVTTGATGVATATAFTANSTAGGPYTVAAKAGAIGPADFSLTNLSAPPAAILATTGSGQSAQISAAFATNLQATVNDSGSHGISGVTVTFTAPGSGASGKFTGGTNNGLMATAVTNSSGVATAPVFTANTAAGGPYNVQASAGSVSVNFSLTNTTGPAASIVATGGATQSVAISTAFATLQATVKDSGGNPINGATVTFTAPATGASGTFAGGTSGGTVVTATTNASGVANATAFTANTIAGAYTVSASVAGVSTKATFSLTNLAGPASKLLISGGGSQSVAVNTAFAALAVTVTDASNNGISGVSVTFTAPSAGASGAFAAPGAGATATVATNASGVATAPAFTSNNTVGGPYVVAASSSGLTTVNFSLTNLAGTPASITASSGSAQSVAIGTPFAALVATVKDNKSNPLSGVVVTFTAPASGASGTFAGGTSGGTVVTATTDANGNATASTFTANGTAGGPYNVAATAGAVGPANFSLTNLAGAPASVTATAGATQSAVISTVFGTALGVTVKDSGGNLLSGVVVTFTSPSSGASGTFAGGTVNGTTVTATTGANGIATAPTFTANSTVGTYTVNASVSGVATKAAFALSNTPGPAALIAATAGTPQNTTISTAFATALQATVTDSGGNPISGASVTFTAPATGASGTFASPGTGATATVTTNASGVATAPAFTAGSIAGAYTVNASVSGVTAKAAFLLTNNAGSPASISATAGTPQSAPVTIAFTTNLQATVKDSGGNPVSNANVTFTAPSTGASGTFTGGATTVQVKTDANGNATATTFTANATGGTYNVTAAVTGVVATASFSLTNTVAPDVTIAKSHTGDFTVGSSGVYTFTVTNHGTGATTGNITVTDTLPAGLTFVSNTGTGWACAANAQLVTCTYTGAALAAAGGNSTFTMTVSVAPGAFPSVINSATVADPNDGKTTDKSATDAAANIDNAVPTTQSSISPALGLIAGATSPQQIVLTGTGFNSSTIVTLGSTAPLNTPLTGTANAAGTSLTINVPANELASANAGSLTLTVSNPKNPTSNLGGGTATTNPTLPLVAMSSLTPQSGTANPVPIVAGTPFALQMNLNLTPSGTALPADVTITCSFPMALAGATCTPAPGTIAHGSTSASTVITINAIPTSGSVVGPSTFTPWNGGQGPWAQYLLWLTVAALLSMLAMLRTVRQRAPQFGRASAYLTLVLLVFAAGALVGCTSAAKTTPTPTGPSSITVTATTADGATVSATVNITVTN